jgi:UDP-N-acetylmuramoyl-tripeptide--D-alanyl-D-alanine ligase
MRLSEAATALAARRWGPDCLFQGFAIDSRRVAQGNLFVALRGPRYDGHTFLHQARARGAAACLVERRNSTVLPSVVVHDTRAGLGELARAWRSRFSLPLVAVTGSNGKTTVKELVAAILDGVGPTLATAGNLNNEIGVPCTLLGLGEEHQFAVVEMGANRPGEIARLSSMALPTVAVITQCAPAHLEGFGSIDGVARAKGELIEGADAAATIVINGDDCYAPLWRELAGGRPCLAFGLEQEAEVTATWRPSPRGTEITLTTPVGSSKVQLPLLGRHNVLNALAATSAALAIGVPLDLIRTGLERAPQLTGRLQILPAVHAGAVVINDSYNANPASMSVALDVLAGYPGQRWLVVGDMGELGADTSRFHWQVGELARARGVQRLYAVGEQSQWAVQAFGEGAAHFVKQGALIKAITSEMRADLTVLVKGSRAMRMEEVVDALTGGYAEF